MKSIHPCFAVLLCMGLVACAATHKAIEPIQAMTVDALRLKMNSTRSHIETMRGEARLTYFGPSGRIKGTATIAASRPGSFRYNVLGPHGGVVEAFSTDGRELQVLKLMESRYLYGPATAETLDRLMAFAPLQLDSTGWVGLLFGSISVPDTAAVRVDQATGRIEAEWPLGLRQITLDVDPRTWMVERLRVRDGDVLVSEVIIAKRDELGLPAQLQMRVPGSEVELELRLRDVEVGVAFPDGTFYIEPPRGFRAEYVGPSHRPVD